MSFLLLYTIAEMRWSCLVFPSVVCRSFTCGFPDCARCVCVRMQEALEYTRSKINRGRPKLSHLFDDISKTVDDRQDVIVMACGPESMILDASEYAFKYGFAFHTEIFNF